MIHFLYREDTKTEIAQDMYPVRGIDRDIHPIKDFRPAYKYWAIRNVLIPLNPSLQKGDL